MELTVIGCGYLGAVHAAAMAELGHNVLGVETDPARAAALDEARAPFYEPGLPELLASGTASGRLRFTSEATEADLAAAQVHFVTVGTPAAPDGSANLAALDSVILQLARALPERPLDEQPLVVGKSTLTVGTAARADQALAGRALVVWNPEFLREGQGVKDTLYPDRIVYGLPAVPDEARRAAQLLDAVYQRLLVTGVPRLTMDYASAELVKTAANSFLARKISFINAVATLCENSGADITLLADALGRDDRIGAKFLGAGIGFGGGCLPKDILGLEHRARQLGADGLADLLSVVGDINHSQRGRVVERVLAELGPEPEGRRVAVLGATFKPNSDDLRDSPAIEVAARLDAAGVHVVITDPHGLDAVTARHPNLAVEPDPYRAIAGSACTVLLTEWAEFRDLDAARAAGLAAAPVVIDARNALNPDTWKAAGWRYSGVGR